MISTSINLNADVLHQIFYYSSQDVRTLISWSLVSTKFYKLSNNIDLWKKFTKNHLITDTVQELKNSFFTTVQKKCMDACAEKQLIIQTDNPCNYMSLLKNILKSLESVNENEKLYQIFVLKKFLPSTVTIPNAFICSINRTLMLNPVRDLCGGQSEGHVFEEDTILQQLSTQQTKEPIGVTTTAPCPISHEAMPKLTRTSIGHKSENHYDVFSSEDGQILRRHTEIVTTLCRIAPQEALMHDEKLQSEILDWLKQEIFETHFDSLPTAAKNSICPSSIMDERIKALYYYLIESAPQPTNIPAPFEEQMKKIFTLFSPLPSTMKDSIYSLLLPNAEKHVTEDTFYDRNGKTSSIAEKTKALRRYLQELQMKFLFSEAFK